MLKGARIRDIGRGKGRHNEAHRPAGVSAVSPQESDQRGGKEMREGEEDVEGMFPRVFGESVEDTLKETRGVEQGTDRGGSPELKGGGRAKLGSQCSQELVPASR